LRRFFGQVEVIEEPNQRGDNTAPIGAIDRLHSRVDIREHVKNYKKFSAEVSIRALAVRLTDGGRQMRYMLLIYLDEQALSETELEECYVESAQLAQQIHSSGQYLAAAPLYPTATATSVRVRDGKRLVTDGPFAETREQLGGYFLIEAK